MIKTKFRCYPERKKKQNTSNMYDVCSCGHTSFQHGTKINHNKNGSGYEVIHTECERCICQKYKEVVKMSATDYYNFTHRFESRIKKLVTKNEIIERETNLVPFSFMSFLEQIQPQTQSTFKIKMIRLLPKFRKKLQDMESSGYNP
jgi:hypothetical protein